MQFRVASTDDLDFAIAQTRREGWDTPRALFEVCLEHDREGFMIVEIDAKPVAMVTAMRLRRSGWVGNLITEPALRSQGIGRFLLLQAMVYLRHPDIRTVWLEADPPGVALYESVGFIDEFESQGFLLHHRSVEVASHDCEPLTEGSLQELGAWDAERFGDDRTRLLRLLFRYARGGYIVRDSGAILGYLMLWPSERGMRIGPWVACDVNVAEQLLRAALTVDRSCSVIVATPKTNVVATEVLRRYGFEPGNSCRRMSWGDPGSGGKPDSIYGIANGAMG